MCGFTSPRGGLNANISLAFSVGIYRALSAPLHTHFGDCLTLKPFTPCQSLQKLLGTGAYLSSLVRWNVLGTNSPCVRILSLALALRHPSDHSSDQLRAVSHPLDTRLESGSHALTCHPRCSTCTCRRSASCQHPEFVWCIAPQTPLA